MSASDKNEKAVSRRKALQRIGLAGAGALAAPVALGGCRKLPWRRAQGDPTGLALNKPYVPGAEFYGIYEERWLHSSCGQCPAGCGIRVRVVEGRAVRVEGNPKNPLNQGGIGARGLSSLQALYDADRIKTPLAREGESLVPITWEEALKRLGGKLADLRQRGAADKLLVLCGRERGFMLELFSRFARAFGTPNVIDGRPGRSAVLAQAMQATLGHFEIPAYDWTRADYIVSFEAGLLEDSCQSVYFARAAGEFRRGHSGHRAKLVHCGPMFDLSAHNADDWIMIRPGTGGALALGICHVLVAENRFDQVFVKDLATGFDAAAGSGPSFRQFLETHTPEKTAEATGTTPDVVVKLARDMAASGAAFGFVDDRSLSYSNGWHTALAVLSLNALLGAVERKHGGVRIGARPPYADWPAVEPDEIAAAALARPRLDGAGGEAFPLARSIHETLPDAIAKDPAQRPEIALLYHSNPVWARQQPARWLEAMRKIPFVVSFSPYRDETVEAVAHLVLPDHTFLERWEDADAAPGLGRAVAGIRRPVIEPLHDTRATGDVLITVAQAMGGSIAAAFPWPSFKEALEARLAGLQAVNRGTLVAPNVRAFTKRMFEEGFWAELDDPVPQPVEFKFQGSYAEPEWDGDPAQFPLKLVVYRPAGYAEGSGANQPWLRELRSRPNLPYWATPVTAHPDALPRGVKDGALLTLTTPYGQVTAPVRVDRRMEPGYVALPAGGGHTAFGRWGAYGVNAMTLVKPGPAPQTGANVLCSTRVKVELAAPNKRES